MIVTTIKFARKFGFFLFFSSKKNTFCFFWSSTCSNPIVSGSFIAMPYNRRVLFSSAASLFIIFLFFFFTKKNLQLLWKHKKVAHAYSPPTFLARIFSLLITRGNFLFDSFFFRTLWRHGPNAASTFTSTFCQEVSSSS